MPYSWDSKALRYRAPSGQFVKRGLVKSALESGITETQNRILLISQQLQRGEINLSQFILSMRDNIKAQHLLSAGIARGGKAQLSPAILGKIGSDTKSSMSFYQGSGVTLNRAG
jgi:hypothetical protein